MVTDLGVGEGKHVIVRTRVKGKEGKKENAGDGGYSVMWLRGQRMIGDGIGWMDDHLGDVCTLD